MASCGSYVPNEANVLERFSQLLSSGNSHVLSPFFSNNVVLDWYGRTVAGKDNVVRFLFNEITLTGLDMTLVEPCGPIIEREALRSSLNRLRLKSAMEEDEEEELDDDSGIASFYESDSSFCSSNSETPCSKMAASLARMSVTGSPAPAQSLRHHTNPLLFRTPKNCLPAISLRRNASPVKGAKPRFDGVNPNISFLEAKGTVHFNRFEQLHSKELQWYRQCRLQLGYCCSPGSSVEESLSFSYLLFQDDMPCRRNLSLVFEQCY